ncbi:MAG: hypothetical protein FWG13_06435 [Leptospirales bacterium]|nr:hypothetical protein [Leptospirales bacterium]
MLKKRQFSAFIIIFALVSVYVFVLGESGLLERMALYQKKEFLLERVDFLKEYNQKLEEEIRSNKSVSSADFLNAGFIPQGGKVVVLKGLEESVRAPVLEESYRYGGIRMSYLRGTYCVLSLLALLFYFSYWGRGDNYG